jgi:hypothetical protein
MHRTNSPLRWRGLRQPKRGHTEEEFEDAWAVKLTSGRFAIADGASESAFAALWARLLAEGFVAAARPPDFSNWLDAARRRWSEEVMDLKLPWYADMKRAEGAFATLLGLSVRPPTPDRPGAWRADAVGESFLVHVRKGRRPRSFPLKRSADFGNEPRLIGSRQDSAPTPQRATGSLLPDDRLLLMTDALAQWFLRAYEGGAKPWDAVTALLSTARPEDTFAAWVEELRGHSGLRNDDVTLLVVDFHPVDTKPAHDITE